MSTAERPPLDRERIVTTAIGLADEHGVGALSMRKLAKHLDFEVMSLYNHVANKSDLLDAMVDVVAGEIVEPEDLADWRIAVRTIAVSAHQALLRHPWATELWSKSWPGPNRFRHMETLLEVLARAGFPDDVADLAFHAITMHISGFTYEQVTFDQWTADHSEAEMYDRFEREVPRDAYPRLHEHVHYHQVRDAAPGTPIDEFEYVLDLILDGLEQSA